MVYRKGLTPLDSPTTHDARFAAVGHLAYAEFGEQHPRSVIPKFTSALRIPQILQPVRSDDATDYYEITQRETDLEILPGKQTRVWGYNGMFPAPPSKHNAVAVSPSSTRMNFRFTLSSTFMGA